MELKPIYVFSKTKQITLTRKELNELLQQAFNQGFYVGSNIENKGSNNPVVGFRSE